MKKFSRKTIYGTNFLISVLLLLGVLGLANFLAVRYNLRKDTTEEKLYSLSDQSVKILTGLKKPIHFTVFFTDQGGQMMGMNRETVVETLKKYANYSSQVDWKIIDPYQDPKLAGHYKIKSEFTIVIECGNRSELVESIDEVKIVSAILKVSRPGNKKIYFLTGHGERLIQDQQERGYSTIGESLKNNNYDFAELVLVREKSGVPDDCALLVIAGAEKELLDEEYEWIDAYSLKGGPLLVLLAPTPAAELAPLLSKWGIKVRNDLILDDSNVRRFLGTGPNLSLVVQYPFHMITKDLRAMTIYPLARSLEETQPAPTGISIQKILESSQVSWGETDLEGVNKTGTAEFSQGKDIPGPLTIGLAAERQLDNKDTGVKAVKTMGRLVAIGDADFVINAYLKSNITVNSDLFLNAVNWLTRDEDLISIRPKNPVDKPIALKTVEWLIILAITGVWVALLMAVGIILIVKRRRR